MTSRRGVILVVDDEPEVREVLCDFLEGQGHEILTAENGVVALGVLARRRPDLVLLDVAMPEMDGLETLQRIITDHPNLPVIMVTAYADVGTASNALTRGAADYVPKPFDLAYVDQVVDTQLSAASPGAAPAPVALELTAEDAELPDLGPGIIVLPRTSSSIDGAA